MASLASDNFNRSDGSIGSNWSLVSGANLPDISSNQVVRHANEQETAYWNADMFNADHFTELTVKGVDQLGPAVRCSASNGYIIFGGPTAGAGGATLWKQVAGSFTNLGSCTMPTTNDVWRLQVRGTSIQPYINGVADGSPFTDSSLSTGQPGFLIGGASAILDDWSGGDLDRVITIPVGTLDLIGGLLNPPTPFAVKFQHA